MKYETTIGRKLFAREFIPLLKSKQDFGLGGTSYALEKEIQLQGGGWFLRSPQKDDKRHVNCVICFC